MILGSSKHFGFNFVHLGQFYKEKLNWIDPIDMMLKVFLPDLLLSASLCAPGVYEVPEREETSLSTFSPPTILIHLHHSSKPSYKLLDANKDPSGSGTY